MASIIKNDVKLCDVSEVNFVHGKQEYTVAPDFCGTSSRVPGHKHPDQITFITPIKLEIENEYFLRYDNFNLFKIKIQKIKENQVTAVVQETLNPHD